MSDIIEDGKGRGHKMSVSKSQRGNVSAKTNPRRYYESRNNGRAFNWLSNYSASSGDIVLYIKNNDPNLNLIISRGLFSADANASWSLKRVTGTAAGTDIKARILNFTKATVPLYVAKGDAAATGLTADYIFGSFTSLAGVTLPVDFDDELILGFGHAVAVQYTGNTGFVDLLINGFYESHAAEDL